MNGKKELLIFKDKQTRILIAMLKQDKQWHISDIAAFTGVTYVHTSRFINACEKIGIINSEKHGRMKTISLTETGVKITEQINGIIEAIKSKDNIPEKK